MININTVVLSNSNVFDKFKYYFQNNKSFIRIVPEGYQIGQKYCIFFKGSYFYNFDKYVDYCNKYDQKIYNFANISRNYMPGGYEHNYYLYRY